MTIGYWTPWDSRGFRWRTLFDFTLQTRLRTYGFFVEVEAFGFGVEVSCS